MKRFLSMFLALILLLSTLASCSISSLKDDNNTGAEDNLTVGQWLGMVNNTFGMYDYSQQEPYISNIDTNNKYFKTIQIAAEWNVIDQKQKVDPDAVLTWKYALTTLVNVGDFVDFELSEDDKVNYALNNFGYSADSISLNKTIDIATANELLINVHEKWVNRTYENKSTIDYIDSVIDLTNIKEDEVSVEGDEVFLDEKLAANLHEGDIFVLPNIGSSIDSQAYRVEDIEVDNGISKITTDTNLELKDFVEELYLQDTFTPDLSNAAFYAPDGTLIDAGNNFLNQSSSINTANFTSNLVFNPNSSLTMTNTAKKGNKFKVDDCEIELTINNDGIEASVEVPFTKDDKTKAYAKVEINNFKISHKIDFKWFKLRSAELKVDYEVKKTVGLSHDWVSKDSILAPKFKKGQSLLKSIKEGWKDYDKLKEKTIKIGTIAFGSIGVASFTFDVHAKFKFDGSVEFTVTEKGSKGIEYKDKQVRVINNSNKDKDFVFKAKAEGTVSVGPTMNAFGIAIVGLSAEFGIGAQFSNTLHLVDSDNHLLEKFNFKDIPPEYMLAKPVNGLTADVEEIKKLAESQGGTYIYSKNIIDLHIDYCIDFNIYFILRIGLSIESEVGKILSKLKVKVQWDIYSSENAKICNIHVENFDFITAFKNIKFFTNEDQCTRKYRAFDDADQKVNEDSTSNENDQDNKVNIGEVLILSDMKKVLNKGESTTISILQIPAGYKLSDFTFTSNNSDIATVDNKGNIVAKNEGSTTVVVKSKDGKYSCACSISVLTDNENTFTPLNSNGWKSENHNLIAA